MLMRLSNAIAVLNSTSTWLFSQRESLEIEQIPWHASVCVISCPLRKSL